MQALSSDAVKEMPAKAEEAEGPSENWDVNKWKDFATKVLNSDEPAIKTFLDELEENNAGAKAALATAISSGVSLSLIARVVGAVVPADTEAFFGDFIICFTCNIQQESVTHKVISTGCTLTTHLCRNVRIKRTKRTMSPGCGGVSLRRGRSWVGWVQISPLFHEDDQDDQILIDHLAWVVCALILRRRHPRGWFAKI
jgi:hypothetical protein